MPLSKEIQKSKLLQRHQRAHTEETLHLCVLHGYGKAFGRFDNLAQHLKTHFKHVGLSEEDLERLMDDSKILVDTGKASTLANTLESQESLDGRDILSLGSFWASLAWEPVRADT